MLQSQQILMQRLVNTMTCKFCGAEFDDALTICPFCQQAVAEQPAEQETENLSASEPCETPEIPAEEPAEEVTEETPAQTVAEAPAEEPMEAPVEAPKKGFPLLAVIFCGLAACAVVALIIFGPKLISSLKSHSETSATESVDDSLTLTDRDVYSVQDVEGPEDPRMAQVVASCGETTLTNSDLQILYRIEYENLMYYAPYYAMYGMEVPDESIPLSDQVRTEDGLTWEQYFLKSALEYGEELVAVREEGRKNGFELDAEAQEAIDSLAQNLEDEAVSNGFDSALAYVQDGYGAGVSVENFIRFYTLYTYANAYEQEVYNALSCTEAEVNAFYENNPDVMTSNGISKQSVTVRHILIQPADADGDDTSTDEEWAEAETEAQRVYELFLADPTEENFIALSDENNDDPGSAENGGLYENVIPGQTVTEFNDWIFVEGRKEGDCEIVKTTYGYHLIYFISGGESDSWYASCEELCKNDKMTKEIERIVEDNPLKVLYGGIVLDDVQKKSQTDAGTEEDTSAETVG